MFEADGLTLSGVSAGVGGVAAVGRCRAFPLLFLELRLSREPNTSILRLRHLSWKSTVNIDMPSMLTIQGEWL